MPSAPNILVIGSSNTDLVVYCDRLPKPGETVLGGEFQTFGGGKGANQAVAAARAGGAVTFLGAYGRDSFGAQARERLAKEKIALEYFYQVDHLPSGVALILVDGVTRDNLIAVARSANESVNSRLILEARTAFERADVFVSQLEIPDEAITSIALLAAELGKTYVLNPAPSRPLTKSIYSAVHTIVVNEHEAVDLSGSDEIAASIDWFHTQGCRNVVVTLGADGVSFSEGHGIRSISAPKVTPVDTTGAGDCFVGWLSVGLGEGLELSVAVDQACRAASLAVTRPGAQSGMPYRHEVQP
ncbi:MAG: ribokinase [Verrucomicrobia bacterium]|nr:ribokinase [Verrucomicrobiota bacterium]